MRKYCYISPITRSPFSCLQISTFLTYLTDHSSGYTVNEIKPYSGLYHLPGDTQSRNTTVLSNSVFILPVQRNPGKALGLPLSKVTEFLLALPIISCVAFKFPEYKIGRNPTTQDYGDEMYTPLGTGLLCSIRCSSFSAKTKPTSAWHRVGSETIPAERPRECKTTTQGRVFQAILLYKQSQANVDQGGTKDSFSTLPSAPKERTARP